jgi:hypothetical protein
VKFRDLLAKIEMRLRPLQFGPGLGKLDDADGVTDLGRVNEAETPPPTYTPGPEDDQ